MINYCHADNLHAVLGPAIIVPYVLRKCNVKSVLDVGCGTGVWLSQFMLNGVQDIYGVDGVGIDTRDYLADKHQFKCLDLNMKWDLCRKYDLVICLEVAEHLRADSASIIVETLCSHADLVLFSAACPHQPGQGHINCQWPEYWQQLFNDNCFYCEDFLRPQIWNQAFPEYWYKQNIFLASLSHEKAGKEQRIHSHVHPALYEEWVHKCQSHESLLQSYENLLQGKLGIKQSLKSAVSIAAKSVRDTFGRRVLLKRVLSQ